MKTLEGTIPNDIAAELDSLHMRCEALENLSQTILAQVTELTRQVEQLNMFLPLPTTTKRKAGA